MAANRYILKSNNGDYAKIIRQRETTLKKYDFLKVVSQTQKEITFGGKVQPNGCDVYEIRVIFKVSLSPKVFIKSPVIPFNSEIHMYSDTSLCLYYPKEMPWNNTKLIANTIIPWTIEWIIFYELWYITGKWLAPEVKHGLK